MSSNASGKENLSRELRKSVTGVSSVHHSPTPASPEPEEWVLGPFPRWNWSLELLQSCTCGCFVPKHSEHRICPAVLFPEFGPELSVRSWSCISHISSMEMEWNVTNQHSRALKALTEMMAWEKSMEIICRDKPGGEKRGNSVSQGVAQWCDKYKQPWGVISCGVSLQDDSSWDKKITPLKDKMLCVPGSCPALGWHSWVWRQLNCHVSLGYLCGCLVILGVLTFPSSFS